MNGCDEETLGLYDVSILLPVAVRLYAASEDEAQRAACLIRLGAQSGGFVQLSTGFPEVVKVVAVGDEVRPDRNAIIDRLQAALGRKDGSG